MSAWKKITKTRDNRIPVNTIGQVVDQDNDYYYLSYYDTKIQVLKTDTTNHTSQIGLVVSYRGFPINYKITEYIGDHKTGANTYTGFTGKRVKITALSEDDASDNNLQQHYDVYVDQLTFI
jgi:hypothetical protein